MKTCTTCGKVKPLEDFFADRRLKSGRGSKCRLCVCARQSVWYYANHEHVLATKRARHIRTAYGLTVEEYEALLAEPCAICGSASEHMDHCHDTNKRRAALCSRCNVGLGHFLHDEGLLRKAAVYLKEHA